MVTIDERAKKSIHEYYLCDGEYTCERFADCVMSGGYNTPFDCCECTAEDYEQGYIKGATEQKQIDDREMSDGLFIQRQMFFEKACEQFCHCMGCGMYDKCHSEGDFCDAFSNFKKAMEE